MDPAPPSSQCPSLANEHVLEHAWPETTATCQSMSVETARIIAVWVVGDRVRKACRGKGGRVGGACGQGIGGEGPATQASAPSPCASACPRTPTGRRADLQGPGEHDGACSRGIARRAGAAARRIARRVRAPRQAGAHRNGARRYYFFATSARRCLISRPGLARAFQA